MVYLQSALEHLSKYGSVHSSQNGPIVEAFVIRNSFALHYRTRPIMAWVYDRRSGSDRHVVRCAGERDIVSIRIEYSLRLQKNHELYST